MRRVLVGGLALTPHLEKQSYSTKDCDACWVYNQWMGTVPWTADMPHDGPGSWVANLPDPYNQAWRRDNPHGDDGWSRYMGGARFFAHLADRWLE